MEKLDLAEQSENITQIPPRHGPQVYSRSVQKSAAVFELLANLDESEGINNPLGFVSKLQILVIQANTREKLEFMVPSINGILQSRSPTRQ